ncbi:acyltransferase family protein [Microbacterium rhizophilus]|uniref:acyltransferase family protein n=1 Tax=Microbacterium rhizophilus TaxID=3138934 RepID=UPI0031F01DB0
MTRISSPARAAATSRRDVPVDTLRGIACILLVTMHVIGFDDHSGIAVPDDSAFRWYAESFIYLRMPLFTFLAGFVYAWRPVGPGTYRLFMGKKIRRLLIPYVIFVALIGIMQTALPGANNPTDLAPWQWFVYSLSPYWFLISTFWIFAVVALLDSYRLLERWYVLAAVGIALIVINLAINPGEKTVLQWGNSLTLAPFFIVGIMAHRFQWARMPRWAAIVVSAAVVVLFAYTQLGFAGVVPVVNSRHDLLGVLLGALFPVACLSWRLGWSPLARLGAYSSGIFLLHPFAVAGTREIFERLHVTDDVVLFVICSVIGILLAAWGTRILKRYRPGRFVLGEKV